MQTKPEFRRSERFPHEYIIQFGEDLTLSPYYAVSCNLSETGKYFKSLFKLYRGSHIHIVINDHISRRDQVPARVVWCKELENTATFRYDVGVEFLQLQKNFGLKASLPIAPRMKTQNMRKDEAVIEMGKS